jgi:hypothetical protein
LKEGKYYRFSALDQSMTELRNISLIKDEDADYFSFLNEYSKPLVCKNSEGFYGILDGKGTEIVPFIYEDIITFGNAENEIVVKKKVSTGFLTFRMNY